MGDEGKKGVHKQIELEFNGQFAFFKIRKGSQPEHIKEAVRGRFQQPKNARFTLMDEEGCYVVMDDTLTSGRYKLAVLPPDAAVT
eukprot:g1566.t1